MKYPTLSRAAIAELAPIRLATGTCDVDDAVTWSGDGEEFLEQPVAELAVSLRHELEVFEAGSESPDRDLFEGRAAAKLHATLKDLPLLVLDDPGFWRYLTLKHFWELVAWRESATFAQEDYAKYRKYIDGVSPSECVLIRMFLRAQIALHDGDYALAYAVPKGTDFWRSHILRVRTSAAPVISRAFVREQASARMGTEELRQYARRLNRIRTNVVLNVYEPEEARKLIEELRQA